MRIGIDARFLTHPQQGGFKTYSENLIEAISQIDNENEYVIYVDRFTDVNFLPNPGNFIYRIVNGAFPFIGMMMREQFLLPVQAPNDNIDIFHSLCNTSPVHFPVKRVVTLHDTIQVTSRRKIRRAGDFKVWAIYTYSKWSILRSVHGMDRVITVSDCEKEEIIQLLNIPREKVVVTHLAANAVFRPARSEEIGDLKMDVERRFGIGDGYILGIGYEERKNISLLIDSYKRLSIEFPQISLVIVCAEDYRRSVYQKYVDDHDLAARVTLLGPVSASDLRQLYNLAAVFVFPSERESFGLPPLEAISCGVPTVAMNSSSIPEILGDGALLVDGKDPKNWSDAISTIIRDKGLRAALIARGLKRASELNWKRCAMETIQVYRQMI